LCGESGARLETKLLPKLTLLTTVVCAGCPDGTASVFWDAVGVPGLTVVIFVVVVFATVVDAAVDAVDVGVVGRAVAVGTTATAFFFVVVVFFVVVAADVFVAVAVVVAVVAEALSTAAPRANDAAISRANTDFP
jgi:hypothetical protein